MSAAGWRWVGFFTDILRVLLMVALLANSWWIVLLLALEFVANVSFVEARRIHEKR